MTTFFDPKAAKRMVTYGKLSRKGKSAYGSFFASKSPKVSQEQRSISVVQETNHHIISDDSDELSHSKIKSVQAQSPVHKSNKTVSTPEPSATTAPRGRKSGDVSCNKIYDIPSSEDELGAHLASPRKKRRLTPANKETAKAGQATVREPPLVRDANKRDGRTSKEANQQQTDEVALTSARRFRNGQNAAAVQEDVQASAHRTSARGKLRNMTKFPPSTGRVRPVIGSTRMRDGVSHKPNSQTVSIPANATSILSRSPQADPVHSKSPSIDLTSNTEVARTPPTSPTSLSVKSPAPITTPRQAQLLNTLLVPELDGSYHSNGEIKNRAEVPRGNRHIFRYPGLAARDHQDTRARIIDSLNAPREHAPQVQALGSKTALAVDVGEDEDDSQLSANHIPIEEINTQSSQSSRSLGSRVTYARQRSYLSETLLNEVDDLANQRLPIYSRITLAQPALSKDLDTFATRLDLEDTTESAEPGSIRSIHELRQAGGNARFYSEADALFEDIENRGPVYSARKRAGLMSLYSKLGEGSFARQFLDTSQDSRLLACCTGEADVTCCFLLGIILTLLLKATSSTSKLEDCVDAVVAICPVLLPHKGDVSTIVKERQANMSKSAQGRFKELCSDVQRSATWDQISPARLTPQFVALRCLEVAIRRTREAGDFVRKLPHTLLALLLDALIGETNNKKFPEPETYSFQVIEVSLSALESYMCAGIVLKENQDEAQLNTLRHLRELGPIVGKLTQEDGPAYQSLQILAIRLVLTITNENQDLCEALSTTQLIDGLSKLALQNFETISNPDQSEEGGLDVLILALGCLLNLGEGSVSARRQFRQSFNASESLVDRFLSVFLERLSTTSEAESVEEMHANIALGYLSIMLGTLCLDSEMRDHICKSLPAQSLDPLLGTIEEFLRLYRQVEEEDADGGAGFTARFQRVVDQLRFRQA